MKPRPAKEPLERRRVVAEVAAGLTTAIVVALAYWSPDLYELHMQEDHFAEWLTAALFAISGVIRMRAAIRERHVFDGLVALFCFFVAGEEFSWGQRLIGYTPPAWFLSHNVQQEATLHNFAGVFGRPKWSLIAVLAGYGLLLPLARRFDLTRKLMDRVGATAPPAALAPWFAMTVVLLIWYPLGYTGEWTELVAGLLFLGAVTTGSTFLMLLAVAMVIAWMLAAVSAQRSGGENAVACAEEEVSNLLEDITTTAGATELLRAPSLETRVWSAILDEEIDATRLTAFAATRCDGSIPTSRRRYAVDPWGSSYWVVIEETEDGGTDVEIYSLGPNRRRDLGDDAANDDIVAGRAILQVN